MERNIHVKLMARKLPRISQCMHILLLLSCVGLVGCSKTEPTKESTATQRQELLPILEIKDAQYTFSMFPQFETESQSRLKLGIRDAKGNFIREATVTANLIAQDGHKQQAVFREDALLEKYIARIPLNHHEDYVIDTQIEMKGSERKFNPKFSFHCCDPIELLNGDTVGRPEGSSSK